MIKIGPDVPAAYRWSARPSGYTRARTSRSVSGLASFMITRASRARRPPIGARARPAFLGAAVAPKRSSAATGTFGPAGPLTYVATGEWAGLTTEEIEAQLAT